MSEKDWEECLINNSARIVSPDKKRAESLVETAMERISLIKDINKINCNFVFEDYYTSLLEILQAITFKQGFNVHNHICLSYYLRDILKREDLYILFDDLRYKRNSLLYYGKRMDFDIAKQSIDNCKRLIIELKKLVIN